MLWNRTCIARRINFPNLVGLHCILLPLIILLFSLTLLILTIYIHKQYTFSHHKCTSCLLIKACYYQMSVVKNLQEIQWQQNKKTNTHETLISAVAHHIFWLGVYGMLSQDTRPRYTAFQKVTNTFLMLPQPYACMQCNTFWLQRHLMVACFGSLLC